MNGWSNHATWNANLWFGDIIESHVEDYRAAYAEMDLADMANDIEAFCYEMSGIPEMPVGFASDAAGVAWSGIDWQEICRHYQPEPEPEDWYEGDDDFALEMDFE